MSGQEMTVGDHVWWMVIDARHQPTHYERVKILARAGAHVKIGLADGDTREVLLHSLSWHPNRHTDLEVAS